MAAVVRIAAIEAVPLRFPLDPPFRAALGWIESVDLVLVRVRDTDGVQGTGTAFAFGADAARPILEIARTLGATRVGAPAAGVEGHASAMRAALALSGLGGPAIAALGAIDLALWDLVARRTGLPLWRLLGGARARIASYGSGGSLAVDANQQFSPKAAIRWARAIEPFDPWWIEEPVRADDVAGHAEVRAAVEVDVASGETLTGTADAARMIAARAVDVLMPHLQRVGGLTAWRKLAAAAELSGIGMAAHVHPEVQVHLMCAVPGAVALEFWPGWPWLWHEPIAIADGFAIPPDAPGLGFTLDEDRVRAHRADRR